MDKSRFQTMHLDLELSINQEHIEGPNWRPGRGSEWEPIKILLEGDSYSNKMNTTTKSRLRLNYPSWPRPRSHWSAIGPRKQQPSKPTRERSGTSNLSSY
jgi:hypothetical protein